MRLKLRQDSAVVPTRCDFLTGAVLSALGVFRDAVLAAFGVLRKPILAALGIRPFGPLHPV